MIRSKYNLRCRKGHRHYSPQADLFVGHQCFYPDKVGQSTRKCSEPLARYRNPKS